jgi:F0F1-type ATP synthase membrane subunit b/b'
MASLNLIPNPVVLGAQIGVFLVNYVAVKKLFVEPYLAVRAKRSAVTVGSQEEATKALAQSDQITKAIDQKFLECAAEAKGVRESLRDRAHSQRDELLSSAEAAAKQEIASVEQKIREELAAERARIPDVMKSLSDELYNLALN